MLITWLSTRSVVDSRPAVGRVAQYVASLMTNEVISPRRSHHVSYSMDALSDDEDMDAEQVCACGVILYNSAV